MFSNDEVQHPSEEMESTSLPQIHQGEVGRKAVQGSGVEEIHEVPVFINDAVLLPCLLCPLLSTPGPRWEVMDGLVVLPSTELVPDLDLVLGGTHGR